MEIVDLEIKPFEYTYLVYLTDLSHAISLLSTVAHDSDVRITILFSIIANVSANCPLEVNSLIAAHLF